MLGYGTNRGYIHNLVIEQKVTITLIIKATLFAHN